MKFSLIVCTLGRFDDIDILFASFVKQTYKQFEVILVDQNEDGYLRPIVEKYNNQITIKHIKSENGLSRARNNGLKHADGEIICFPDDDCYYSDDTLKKVYDFFSTHPDVMGVTSGYTDGKGRTGLTAPQQARKITPINVWKSAISFTVFVRHSAIKSLSYAFDETLGVGANTKWGAGEETDFLLRLLENNSLFMIPDLGIFHPVKESFIAGYDEKRVKSYSRGIGRVLKIRNYNKLLVCSSFSLTFLKILINFVLGKKQNSRFYKDILIFRMKGYFD
ncbi:TPA: glycosyltransferase family 2 protein [Citrobacter freundii]